MVISFPFDIFTWKHLIGGIRSPESRDRYVLMNCDLCRPSSVYRCNRREVIPVWPVRLCWRDPACPHQAPQAAHRSVPGGQDGGLRESPAVHVTAHLSTQKYPPAWWCSWELAHSLVHSYISSVTLMSLLFWDVRHTMSLGYSPAWRVQGTGKCGLGAGCGHLFSLGATGSSQAVLLPIIVPPHCPTLLSLTCTLCSHTRSLS